MSNEPTITERIVKNKTLVKIENALNGNDLILSCGYTDAQVEALGIRTVDVITKYRVALTTALEALEAVTGTDVDMGTALRMCEDARDAVRGVQR